MNHFNIVEFHGSNFYQKWHYLVLGLCRGGTLASLIKKRNGLTEGETRFYTIQIAGALKHIHSHGVMHRDIKAGNVFLDIHGNAKVGDFGLATEVDGNTNHCTGTPSYIAPEVIEKSYYDHRVDIWSLGILVFEMLTSTTPFKASSRKEILEKVRGRTYQWPVQKNAVSHDAQSIVGSLLVEAHLRPCPDDIVQYPFFTNGYIPTQTEMRDPVDLEDRHISKSNLHDICEASRIGPWSRNYSREDSKDNDCGVDESFIYTDNILYWPCSIDTPL
jgi:serine/threonine protein kinase